MSVTPVHREGNSVRCWLVVRPRLAPRRGEMRAQLRRVKRRAVAWSPDTLQPCSTAQSALQAECSERFLGSKAARPSAHSRSRHAATSPDVLPSQQPASDSKHVSASVAQSRRANRPAHWPGQPHQCAGDGQRDLGPRDAIASWDLGKIRRVPFEPNTVQWPGDDNTHAPTLRRRQAHAAVQ